MWGSDKGHVFPLPGLVTGVLLCLVWTPWGRASALMQPTEASCAERGGSLLAYNGEVLRAGQANTSLLGAGDQQDRLISQVTLEVS